MNAVERIIERAFGTQAELARALGHRHTSTVQGWAQRGAIPQSQIPAVATAALGRGVQLNLEDFFDFEFPTQSAA